MEPFQERVSPRTLAVVLYLLLTFVIAAAIVCECDGHFIYAMDDPYIGLAHAEGIAHGTYGINPGETTSPSSSVLWPFLMVIGVGMAWHSLLPLVLNVGFGAVTVWFLGKIVEECPWEPEGFRSYGRQIAATVLLIFTGNLVSLVFLGMEHSLQVLLAVICAYGLLRAWAGERMPFFCLAAAVLAPAIRYEMFAIVVAVCIALAAQRRWKSAMGVGLLSLVIPGALALFLIGHGLPALPNSVLAKTGAFAGSSISVSQWMTTNFTTIGYEIYDSARQTEIILILILACLAWRADAQKRWVLTGAVLALGLHFVFGKFGWFHRYEIFAILFGSVILFRVAAPTTGNTFWYGCGVLLFASQTYFLDTWKIPHACQNIYDQQYQMHRFVDDFYKKDVAVNDLGWVSYERAPGIYVLDLYGLASNEALGQTHRDGAWLDRITHQHQVGLAIIYPKWFEGVPSTWTPVGVLGLDSPRDPKLDRVVFYSTRDGSVDEIRQDLSAFAKTLPANVWMQVIPAGTN